MRFNRIDFVALATGMAIFLASVFATALFYEQARTGLDQAVRDRLQATADLAARLTDGDLHRTLARPEDKDSEAYKSIQRDYLHILSSNPDLIYVYSVVDCAGRACLVMDAELPRPGETVVPSGVMEVYEQPSATLKKALATHSAAIEPQPYTDEYGTFLSAYAPVYTSAHQFVGVVGVDMSERQLGLKIGELREASIIDLIIAAVLSIAVGTGVAVLRRRNRHLDLKFRTLASNIPAVIFEGRFDDGLTMTYLNSYIQTLTGCPAVDLVGNRARSLLSLVPEGDRGQVVADIRFQIERFGRFEIECRLVPPDTGGRPVWVRMSGVARSLEDGTGYVVEGFMHDISLRKAAEARLAESETRFRVLADSTPSFLWITDPDGEAMFFNRTWLTCTGQSLDEAVEGGWMANVYPDDLPACHQKFALAVGQPASFQCWFRLLRHDGVYRWMLAECTPKYAASGRFEGFICAATDISDRKAYEAGLKRSNAQLELFFRHTPAAIAVLDENACYLAVSERWKADFHLGGGDIIGRSHFDVFPRLPDRWRTDIELCLGGETRHCEEDGYVRADREIEWIKYDLHPWHEDGAIRGVIMFTEVITEKKRLYDELKRHRDDLQSLVGDQTRAIRAESEKNVLLRNTITAANSASGLEPALQACIDEVCRFTGWPTGECVLLDPQGDAADPTWPEGTLRAMQSGKVTWVAENGEGVIVSPIPLGNEVLGLFRFSDPSARPLSPDLIELLNDIGLQFGRVIDRFRQADSLRRARDAAEESARAKAEFLSNMSHELRTPMHAILNYAGMGQKRLAKDETVDIEKLGRYLDNIHTAGSRLLGLLNNLLDLAKMESGKMRYHFESRELKPAIDHTLMELDSLIRAKSLSVETDYAIPIPQAHFDFERLVQVLVNLFSNAIKFSPEGSRLRLSVSGALVAEGPGVCVSLTDDGEGIPESELDDVFGAFNQSSATKSGAGGTGLGLSICREIIQAHGGRIWAANAPGAGACISFILPAGAASTARAA